MLFVAIGNVSAGTAKERMTRRLSCKYPPGMKPVAEYITCPSGYDGRATYGVGQEDGVGSCLNLDDQQTEILRGLRVPTGRSRSPNAL